jgi:curved DNA-binding protein CbpA
LVAPFDRSALKRAFRRLVVSLHPDQRPGDARAHEEFCRFKRGYDELVARAVG